MNETLTVRICTGTACYVQGGSFLLDIENRLSSEEHTLVEIRGAGCLGACGESFLRPPFALVGETLMGNLTPEGLEEAIRSALARRTGV
jgi:NADH:ubiquinone oxidoreductase subunit E